jgi:hypothetical protein
MRSREGRNGARKDLFRARLDQIADISHSPAKLAATTDWRFLEQNFGAAWADVPSRPLARAALNRVPRS